MGIRLEPAPCTNMIYLIRSDAGYPGLSIYMLGERGKFTSLRDSVSFYAEKLSTSSGVASIIRHNLG